MSSDENHQFPIVPLDDPLNKPSEVNILVYLHFIPMSGLKEGVMKLFDSKTSSLKINCWGLAKLSSRI